MMNETMTSPWMSAAEAAASSANSFALVCGDRLGILTQRSGHMVSAPVANQGPES